MKFIIITTQLLFLSINSYASGCGGYPGYEVINIQRISRIEIKKEEYEIISFGPNFINIKFKDETTQLLLSNNSNFTRHNFQLYKGSLYQDTIHYDQYDGCDSYDQISMKKLTFEIEEEKFSWPNVFEYSQSPYPQFQY